MPWINHPATQDGPVSLLRWVKFHVGGWMMRTGGQWEYEALHPERCPICGGRAPTAGECDHIPF